MDADQLQQYISQYNTAMTPGGSSTGTANFINSPAYNMQYGPGMNQTWSNNQTLQGILAAPDITVPQFFNSNAYKLAYGDNTSANPAERFQNDPGVQMAIKAGMPLLANSYSGKGLGASGPAANAVAQYMYNNYLGFNQGQSNLYNTELQNATQQQGQQLGTYLQQQQGLGNLFGTYQNQLANLAGQGYAASNQQGQNAYTSGQNLAQLLGGYNLSTGQNIFTGGLGVNENIASLLANRGIANANAYLGVGSAMSNNMLQGSMLGAQLSNAQNQSNSQTMNSYLQGMGGLAQAGTLRGYM